MPKKHDPFNAPRFEDNIRITITVQGRYIWQIRHLGVDQVRPWMAESQEHPNNYYRADTLARLLLLLSEDIMQAIGESKSH